MIRMSETDYSILRKRNFYLSWAAAAAAVFYMLVFFVHSWFAPSGSGDNIGSLAPGSMRPLIFLCLAAAAITIAFLPEFGKLLGAFSLFCVVALFIQWINVTAGIKLNLGEPTIPGSDLLGNFLVGARVYDVFALVFALVLLTWDLGVAYKNFRLRFRNRNSNSSGLTEHTHEAVNF